MPSFWSDALHNHPTIYSELSELDVAALDSLRNIREFYSADGSVRCTVNTLALAITLSDAALMMTTRRRQMNFGLEFQFDARSNEFFSNTILRKQYFLTFSEEGELEVERTERFVGFVASRIDREPTNRAHVQHRHHLEARAQHHVGAFGAGIGSVSSAKAARACFVVLSLFWSRSSVPTSSSVGRRARGYREQWHVPLGVVVIECCLYVGAYRARVGCVHRSYGRLGNP